jgi:hypothetical protein
MADVKRILKQLNSGILPDELNFTIAPPDEIYWSKVKYNTFYKSPDYFIGKMPNPEAFRNLPASDLIIQDIIENVMTPLEEMIERQQIINNNLEYKISDININELPETDSK